MADFKDAFARYLSQETPFPAVTRSQPHNGAGSEGIDSGNAQSYTDAVTGYTQDVTEAVTDTGTSQTASESHCHRVTDKTSFSDKKEESAKEVVEI